MSFNPSKYFSAISLLFIFFLIACEKDITVDLPHTKQQLVIEGYIQPGSFPYVLVSKTQDYFSPFDSASLINSTVKNALVTVHCIEDNITDTLIQQPFYPDFGYLYFTLSMTGAVGKTYTLYVKTEDGMEATATAKILHPLKLDSTWFKIQPGQDSLGFVWAHMTEPAGLGNCYRWFAKRIHKDSSFIAPRGSTFDDKFIDGQSFDFAYNRGRLPNSTAADDTNDESGFFKKGDTVVVKFCTVTRESFRFWSTAEEQASNNGNPFASAQPIESNITGGIGIWEGYSPSYDTVIAKK